MNRTILLACFVLLKVSHVVILQRTVSFKFGLFHVYMCAKLLKIKRANSPGTFIYKLKRSIDVYSFKLHRNYPVGFLPEFSSSSPSSCFNKASLFPVHTTSEIFETAYIYIHIFLHRFMWTGL